MIEEAAKELPEGFTAADIVRKVREKYPDVPTTSIRAHVIAMAVNHPSSHHYSLRHKLFWYLGTGRYRLLKADEATSVVEPVEPEAEPEEEVEAEAFSYEFESTLESHLGKSLNTLEEGLQLYKSPDGQLGQQFTTEVGRIDLLAKDKQDNFVVIEIKVGQAGDKTLGQLLRYVGWVKRHLSPNRPVRGIIVSRDVTDALKYAASTLDTVALKEYEVRFTFSDADLEVRDED
jgi:hypothetical protein